MSTNERTGYIYEIKCLVNDKGYVGQTIQGVLVRWAQHMHAAFVLKRRTPLYCAMRKYGLENFKVSILWVGVESQLNAAEKRFVRLRKTFIDTGWGYNLTTGGDHFKHSKATCRKLSRIARRIMATNEGRRMLLGELMRGVPQTEARKLLGSIRGLEYKASRQGKRYFSKEATAKISAASLGRKHTPETCINISTAKTNWYRTHTAPKKSVKECERASVSATNQWANMRPEMLAAIRIACNVPAYRANRSEIAKRQWARMRTEMCAALKAGHNAPSAKAHHSAENKRRWEERRAAQSSSMEK